MVVVIISDLKAVQRNVAATNACANHTSDKFGTLPIKTGCQQVLPLHWSELQIKIAAVYHEVRTGRYDLETVYGFASHNIYINILMLRIIVLTKYLNIIIVTIVGMNIATFTKQ